MKQIIERKDLVYVTLLMLLLNLILFTKDFYQNPKIFEAIGFLSSVISIVLSILAIIYTFFQNFHSSSAIEEINNSSKNLADISIKINETMKFVQNASENLNTELENKFSGVKKDIDDVTRKAISDSFKDIIKYNNEDISINSKDYKNIIERFIQFNSKFNVKKMLMEIEILSTTTETTFEKLQEQMVNLVEDNELTEDHKLTTGMGFFLCFIELLSILNIYSYRVTQKGVKFEKGNNDIIDLLK
ncbi:hypothetical protein ND861_11720 [Leptospira sp. 2 VSF19]|uniref:Uncharacterized protein n=1 Tax=Leptospira soteropolitanensis TaxID=2950025 RepID=A0AAW5VKE3_9LEPT|nr:hypothetical protein [Leptospira soteropolitanensis]MCW7493026.1 hypothetical protein [Leptospira soteropolitanensis]MCW7500904.1 hypothetical protein [Leptospira soteropolitanensis]MCW7522877.1 hypothetical protein [Leptospira soteropolitanensis]MCW7527017.1 hypothetical protein [Leptospira soteropolitanensis]MCW7530595.1 hypothetical protein [Leptospira soteropolitanensis]